LDLYAPSFADVIERLPSPIGWERVRVRASGKL
jgi:hypothetical protein